MNELQYVIQQMLRGELGKFRQSVEDRLNNNKTNISILEQAFKEHGKKHYPEIGHVATNNDLQALWEKIKQLEVELSRKQNKRGPK